MKQKKKSVIHCDYVIAADGAKSKIREQLGIKTEGRGTIGGYYMNIYFEADLSEFIQGRRIRFFYGTSSRGSWCTDPSR